MKDDMVLEVQKWLNITYGEVFISSGYGLVVENGKTSWDVINGLIIGLQIELGIIEVSPNFGEGTISAMNNYGSISENNNDVNQNINKIIQGGCWCTGYNPGGFDGKFDSFLTLAIKELESNIGINESGIVDTKLMKALLTMNSYVTLFNGQEKIRQFQQWLNNTYKEKLVFFYIPCDGLYSRNTQEGIVYGIQFECVLDDIANGWFGPTTQSNLKEKGQVYLGDVDQSNNFVHLFKGSFLCNDVGTGIVFDGIYDIFLSEGVKEFQNFTMLYSDNPGNGDYQTWCELLVSTGDENRQTSGIDYSYKYSAVDGQGPIKQSDIDEMKSLGVEIVGRYITNECGLYPVEDRCWDKELKIEERDLLFANSISIFPIYQTEGSNPEYFSYENGKEAGRDANTIALEKYKIPYGTTIYFTVDYDNYDNEVFDSATGKMGSVGQYFKGVYESLKNYSMGVYGSRNTCYLVSKHCGARHSFVSGMSVGYSGNLGFKLPENWTFNQIKEDTTLMFDFDVDRGVDTGFSSLENNQSNINDFIEQVEIVYEECSLKYVGIEEINKQVCQFYRFLNPGYLGTSSDIVWGENDSDFFEGIKKNLKEIYGESGIIVEILDQQSFEKIELTHMFASVCGYSTHGFSENINFGDFGAWAGDFITLMGDYTNQYGRVLPPYDYILNYCATNNESSYDRNDYYGDIDAVNINKLLAQLKPISIILKEYYIDLKSASRYDDELTNRYSTLTNEYNIISSLIFGRTGINIILLEAIYVLYGKQVGVDNDITGYRFKNDFTDVDRHLFVEAYQQVKINKRTIYMN